MDDMLLSPNTTRHIDFNTGNAQLGFNTGNAKYQTKDIWYDRVEAWVSERRYATTTEILQQCCGIDIGRIDNVHKLRIRSIMNLLGWNSGNKRVDGVQACRWINPNEIVVNCEEGSFDNVIPFSKPLDSDTFSEHVGNQETEKTK